MKSKEARDGLAWNGAGTCELGEASASLLSPNSTIDLRTPFVLGSGCLCLLLLLLLLRGQRDGFHSAMQCLEVPQRAQRARSRHNMQVSIESSRVFYPHIQKLTVLDSHVFCIDCSNQCQLSGQQRGQHRSCPACEASLPNPDDVVVTNLNPTEDYKTSVLSGLSPHIIMECSGRALGFWAYQTTTEMFVDGQGPLSTSLMFSQRVSRILGQESGR